MIAFMFGLGAALAAAGGTAISVGSKAFTEGFVLGEFAADVLERDAGQRVTRRFGLGGTGLLYQALRAGQIDVYPEYTGTIVQAILKVDGLATIDEINRGLEPLGLVASRSLGFQNGYGVAVSRAFAEANQLKTLSDFKRRSARARVAFSSEFMSRPDGYPRLKARYDLRWAENPRSLEHSLAYEALAKNEADVTDVYTTDAKIEKLDLVVLEDDLRAFPIYEAVLLARREFVAQSPKAWRALTRGMVGRFDESLMRHLNAELDIDKKPLAAIVSIARGATADGASPSVTETTWTRLRARTREHLILVGLALAFAIMIGVPLGVLADRWPTVGQTILVVSGMVQTIPSLALLCFLIPVFGVGLKPALAALCMYGLLPVVLNTYIGLRGISVTLRDTAKALGLGPWDRLWQIELPLAKPNIVAGIKTSAIVGIGTATLAALIGAGGYGASIVSGLATNDTTEILMGAVPSALLSLFVYGVFAVIERERVVR